eukprot:1064061-Amphidinium_carterae.2
MSAGMQSEFSSMLELPIVAHDTCAFLDAMDLDLLKELITTDWNGTHLGTHHGGAIDAAAPHH